MEAEVTYRELHPDDLVDGSGFLETLAYLSTVSLETTQSELRGAYREMVASGKVIFVACVGDKVVGTASVVRERKFTHGCSLVGHVEDVVVHSDYRRRGIAAKLMGMIREYAVQNGFRKLILQCSEENRHFYEELGYTWWAESSESMKLMLI